MMNKKKILQLCTFLVLSSTFLTTFSNNATAREKVPQVQPSIIQKQSNKPIQNSNLFWMGKMQATFPT